MVLPGFRPGIFLLRFFRRVWRLSLLYIARASLLVMCGFGVPPKRRM